MYFLGVLQIHAMYLVCVYESADPAWLSVNLALQTNYPLARENWYGSIQAEENVAWTQQEL
jgi:hypothetical protein